MREIKFRVWDGEEMIWPDSDFTGYGIEVNGTPLVCMIHSSGEYYQQDDGLVFMQYTDLKDRDGTEIWEGDIVRTEFRGREYVGSILITPQKGVVAGQERTEVALSRTIKTKVIGNIYENPELIADPISQ